VKTLCILALAGGVVWTGCSKNESVNTADRRVTSAEIEQGVKSRLAADTQLASEDISVNADAEKNQVTLSGTVHSNQARAQAVALAKQAKPGIDVEDRMEVKPKEFSRAEYTEDMARDARHKAKGAGQKIGDTMDDAWIHTKISAKLIANSSTPARKIDVDVVNNMVTLRGAVDSAAAKAEAERVAKDTEGVKGVRNQLKVVAPSSL
jgi:hyperosmotically inducible periplasmic protein